ncbi:MAG: hypothetical protein O4808_14325 [Trichodesmium sp. St17_bin3_1_1]|nr:hypothetical protein [Trichodesmium sp. St17_bin3_1_1]MDE5117920.1 hypothetical protein [Trichodesmium sp. St2_bin2_1]MDE5122503.1 hypothetical protein [Trichodesmium sp. St19_bin1]
MGENGRGKSAGILILGASQNDWQLLEMAIAPLYSALMKFEE